MFWNVSWGFPAFTPEDITLLENYLNGGGNLFIAGQDIGWDVFSSGGNSTFPAAQNFYHTYLDANYVNDASGIMQMTGVSGDPITDGMNFPISYVYSPYPEVIASYSGSSIPILQYTNSSKYGALRYDSGTYKTVYLGIGLEQIGDPAQGRLLVRRVLEWFGVITNIQNGTAQPVTDFRLEQNYPNPFNPTTQIRFSIPARQHVTLTVFDVLGRQIATLVDEEMTAGWHSIQWDSRDQMGRPVSTGIYIYRLKAGEHQQNRKMMLIR
jgi:hypothetical protein